MIDQQIKRRVLIILFLFAAFFGGLLMIKAMFQFFNPVNFSETEGFPCLGVFVDDKFIPNPKRMSEILELRKQIKESSDSVTLTSKQTEQIIAITAPSEGWEVKKKEATP